MRKTTHCKYNHEWTDETTRYVTRIRQYADGTSYEETSRSCRICDKNKSAKYYTENPDKVREIARSSAKIRAKNLRKEALVAYGEKCNCCGETTPEFLHFDHVENDGAEHRREISPANAPGSYKVLVWAKKNGWPSKLQILCHNCGMAKGFYGRCPHDRN